VITVLSVVPVTSFTTNTTAIAAPPAALGDEKFFIEIKTATLYAPAVKLLVRQLDALAGHAAVIASTRRETRDKLLCATVPRNSMNANSGSVPCAKQFSPQPQD
jgi:hypothetical protein